MYSNEFQFFLPTQIIFGVGTLSKIGEETTRLGKKALLVTAAGTMRTLGYTAQVEKILEEHGIPYKVFEEVESNPSTATVELGVKLAREQGCDLIIGLGGGSAIDAAKAIASSAGLGIPILDLMREGMSKKGLPCIAVPTTAGTGAEVTHISVLTIKESKRKDGLRSPYNFPSVAIVDPSLTLGLPSYITAYTGIDALTHAVEAYTARAANPVSDLYARKAIILIKQYLRRAVFYGNDLEARKGMALASNLAGIAIAHAGTGAAHGIGMTVGGICNAEHGVVVGLALPTVIRFNLGTNLEKYKDVAELLGEETHGLSLRRAAMLAAEAVEALLADLNLPRRLGDIGVTEDLIPELMADTKTQRVWLNNSRLATDEEKEKLFRALL
ncbi:MAG: iron-containing alcohol dehydrogenase [Firmicutes bacterium]|nr:iron-containing alcohol dehydrogenase [Bacillota bacterium]